MVWLEILAMPFSAYACSLMTISLETTVNLGTYNLDNVYQKEEYRKYKVKYHLNYGIVFEHLYFLKR